MHLYHRAGRPLTAATAAWTAYLTNKKMLKAMKDRRNRNLTLSALSEDTPSRTISDYVYNIIDLFHRVTAQER